MHRITRLNIFIWGLLILTLVLAYWIVPNFITYLGRAGMEAVIRFRWVFITAIAIFVGIVVWIIYLRFLLAKKSMESQVELDKFRLQLEYEKGTSLPKQIEAGANSPATTVLPHLPEDKKIQ